MKQETYEKINKMYKKAKVWGDIDKIMDKLSLKDLKELEKAHRIVNITTGLDMRQNFFMACMKSEIKRREEKGD